MAPRTKLDNSYHVVTTEATDRYSPFRTILDGFTIEDGNADGPSDRSGGGIYNLVADLTVRNCTFIGNNAASAGGGVFDSGGGTFGTSTSKYINCVFSGNTASKGGGLYNGNGDTRVVNCTFNGNGTNIGKDLYVNDGDPTVVNSIFWSDPGSGIFPPTLPITYSDVRGTTTWPGEGEYQQRTGVRERAGP